jgi:hypothetical protein
LCIWDGCIAEAVLLVAASGVAVGYISARIGGTSYSGKDAAIDATLGAIGGSAVAWLRRAGQAVGVTRGVTRLLEGKQGKHILGHNNYRSGNSILTHKDPQGLLNKFAGKGDPVGGTRGAPGFKERVDFGEEIGKHVDSQTRVATPTTKGIIHYSKDGAHIVLARP